MNLALADKIANAVLYEGYMLYPYRPSSVKNRQRWTFGGIYPQAYSLAHTGDACSIQTECLVVASDDRAAPELDVRVRFLHLMARNVGALEPALREQGAEPIFRPVEELHVGDQLYYTWQEAVEREISILDLDVYRLTKRPLQLPFGFPARHEQEWLRGPAGEVVGAIAREQQPILGMVEIQAARVGEQRFKVAVKVLNMTPLEQATAHSRDEALMRAFVSTHAILGARGGEFVSLLDPPEHVRATADECHNSGVWPVLIGEDGERDLILASPIILYDYPQIAPESAGDLFDGTEIDEILTLRIMTMTEEEKREMRAVDEHSRAMLDRTEALAREQLMRLHGTVRGLRPAREAE